MKNMSKILLLVVIGLLIFAFFYFNVGQHFTLSAIKDQKDKFLSLYAQHPFMTVAVYMLVYIASTALSLPGAAILTLLGGALFGLVAGTIAVSFASTIGATLAFLVSRFLLKDWVQSRFNEKLKKINQGVEREGAFYLFTIRLIPAFPFFVVNLVMGLTPMKVWTFFFVSQIGMLAGTIVYVNAGTQLSQLESLSGILSPSIIASFVALAIFPIVSKKLIDFFKNKNKNKGKNIG